MDGLRTCYIRRNTEDFDEKALFNGWTTDGSAIVQFEDGTCGLWSLSHIKFPVISDYFAMIKNKYSGEQLGKAFRDEELNRFVVDYFLGKIRGDFTDSECYNVLKCQIYERVYG